MISLKMVTKIMCGNFEKSFLEGEKMAALNQERFTLATDDKIEELRNGAKNINTNKSTSFLVKCVEDVVRRKEHSCGYRGTGTG